ncbi:MAG: hypothetical protein CSA03_01805 [Bacteroidetes bacterium]|nr:MAG: hypothetical protein CSA03_01805 [Bacteroidota bacterium]
MSKKEIETFYPKSQDEWRNWLEQNHVTKQSIWVIFYKTATKIPSMSWSDAVDEALCFGWIDSTKKTIDDKSYMQYFSKRKPTSNWSKVNKEKVEQLTKNGKMTQAGVDSIETAKQNGSWTLLDDVEALIVPKDLEEALRKHEAALDHFDAFSKSTKKILLYWVISAKRPETRQKRILEIAQNAKEKLTPKQFR